MESLLAQWREAAVAPLRLNGVKRLPAMGVEWVHLSRGLRFGPLL